MIPQRTSLPYLGTGEGQNGTGQDAQHASMYSECDRYCEPSRSPPPGAPPRRKLRRPHGRAGDGVLRLEEDGVLLPGPGRSVSPLGPAPRPPRLRRSGFARRPGSQVCDTHSHAHFGSERAPVFGMRRLTSSAPVTLLWQVPHSDSCARLRSAEKRDLRHHDQRRGAGIRLK